MRGMNLIITSRDPATASSFIQLLPYLNQDVFFNVLVLCQSPSCQLLKPYLEEGRVETIQFDSNSFENIRDKGLLHSIFLRFKPDAVLTGVSGPGAGIDEAVLYWAGERTIRTYALQSFWGQFNLDTGLIPDTAFVLDDEAVKLTSEKFPEVESVPVGSLKHVDFSDFPSLEKREKNRKTYALSEDELLIGFYGQPMIDVTGYLETVECLVNQLVKWGRGFKLLYRPHPKESRLQRKKLAELMLNAFSNCLFIDEKEDVRESLVACDLVISAFSTCGLDNLYLNEMAEVPFNVSIYLLFDKNLMHWWQVTTGLEEIPLVTEELLLAVDNEDDMIDVFENALRIETRQQLVENAKKHLPFPGHSVRKIMEKLKADYHADINNKSVKQ